MSYAIRIGTAPDFEFYSGHELHGGRAWARSPAMAATFPNRQAAEDEARTLARWLNSAAAAIVYLERR